MATFLTLEDEQINACHQIALTCSKHEHLLDVFHLVVQLCYQAELLGGSAVLKWLTVSQNIIDNKDQLDNNSDLSDSDSEDDEDESVDKSILAKFLANLKQFEEYLKKQQEENTGEQAGEEAEAGEGEYYDEEEAYWLKY